MAANDLADLHAKLAVALRDPEESTWDADELDDLVTWAVDGLYPHVSRPLAPGEAEIPLTANTNYYDVPSGTRAVFRADLFDDAGNELGPIAGNAWEILGDLLTDNAQFHVATQIANIGGTLWLQGYGKYDLAANLIPSDLTQAVIAFARAEAFRRLSGDRQRFEQWLSRNQSQNISVNELLAMIHDADADALRQRARLRTWQRPVPGRQG